MSQPAPVYRVETGDVRRDRDTVLGLWQASLGDPARHAAKFDWFYRDCPFGEPLLQLLHYGDEAVGCAAAGPRRMRWQGREICAGLLADFAVSAGHRTLGPALLLQEAMQGAAATRFELLYGFPNRAAVPIFRRAGFSMLGEMTRHVRVVRHGAYLRRRLPGWLATPLGAVLDAGRALLDRLHAPRRPAACWQQHPGAQADALWAHPPPSGDLAGIRERATLQWRFEQTPLEPTRYLEVHDQHATLQAYFVCQPRDGVLQVRDFCCVGGPRALRPAALHALIRAARRCGCRSVSLELAAAAEVQAPWHKAGFRARESQPVIGKWLRDGPDDTNPSGDLFLTNRDEDE